MFRLTASFQVLDRSESQTRRWILAAPGGVALAGLVEVPKRVISRQRLSKPGVMSEHRQYSKTNDDLTPGQGPALYHLDVWSAETGLLEQLQ